MSGSKTKAKTVGVTLKDPERRNYRKVIVALPPDISSDVTHKLVITDNTPKTTKRSTQMSGTRGTRGTKRQKETSTEGDIEVAYGPSMVGDGTSLSAFKSSITSGPNKSATYIDSEKTEIKASDTKVLSAGEHNIECPRPPVKSAELKIERGGFIPDILHSGLIINPKTWVVPHGETVPGRIRRDYTKGVLTIPNISQAKVEAIRNALGKSSSISASAKSSSAEGDVLTKGEISDIAAQLIGAPGHRKDESIENITDFIAVYAAAST